VPPVVLLVPLLVVLPVDGLEKPDVPLVLSLPLPVLPGDVLPVLLVLPVLPVLLFCVSLFFSSIIVYPFSNLFFIIKIERKSET
jgi:hypothetical protein